MSLHIAIHGTAVCTLEVVWMHDGQCDGLCIGGKWALPGLNQLVLQCSDN